MNTAHELRTRGVVVLDVSAYLWLLGGLTFLRLTVLQAWCNAPELKTPTTSPSVLGAFGASGLPSMFNHPILRAICCALHSCIRAFLRCLAKPGDYFAQRKDRVAFRAKGTKQCKESWHRDIVAGALSGLHHLGGWLNLGESSNFFICAPGTHLEPATGDGFSKITDPAPYNALEEYIEVPPGHIVLFYTCLAHRVSDAPVRCASGDLRLFMGWYLGPSSEPPYDVDKCMDTESVWPLPSGSDQIPPMHARLHLVNWIMKLVDFSRNFLCTIIHIPKSGKNKGEYFRVVPTVHPPPATPHFRPYTAAERAPFKHTQYDTAPAPAPAPPAASGGGAAAPGKRRLDDDGGGAPSLKRRQGTGTAGDPIYIYDF